MPSLFNMPPMGVGFQEGRNGLLGFGDVSLNDRLGGSNSGLLRTATQLSGVDVIHSLQQTLAGNPQAIQILTGTTGNTVQAAGTIGVATPPSLTPTVAPGWTSNPVINEKLLAMRRI